jgi:hypothetical protein
MNPVIRLMVVKRVLLEIARSVVERYRPSILIGYATAAAFAIVFSEALENTTGAAKGLGDRLR